MKNLSPAYKGNEPYTFVCYAHEDSGVVYPEIDWIQNQGVNVWYDEGISPGKNWRAQIGESLERAAHVLFYISKASLASDHCNREINFALDEGNEIIPVYLEEVELTADLKIGLNRVQALHRGEDADYRRHLLTSLGKSVARDEVELPTQKQPKWHLRVGVGLVLAVLLAIGIVFLLPEMTQDPVASAPAEPKVATREGPPMLAVLPFTFSSLGGDSEFFASGVHDDLLTQLAQLQSIRVISRTSVLAYKDTVRNLREIGKALGADAILEGAVQSAGNRIRINAQLIDARTDEHLWAHTYDRELSAANIFDVQTEIARSITSALQATLTVQDATQLAMIPTENMAAYRAYHRAMEIYDDNGVNDEYRQAMEEAVALDPTFTRAWAELAGLLSYDSFSVENPEFIQRAEQILEKIRTLAPKSADYLIAQSYYTYYILKDYDRAHQLITQAQDMSPSDVRLLSLKSFIQRRQGDRKGMTETIRLARTLDPRNPRWTISLTRNLLVSHHYEEASVEIESSAFQNYTLSLLHNILQLREHHNFGHWAEAVEALHKEYGDDADLRDLWDARIAIRDYVVAEDVLSAMREPGENTNDRRGSISQKKWNQIVINWFLQRSDRLAKVLVQARAIIEKDRNSDGDFLYKAVYLDLALLSATEGNTEEAERLIRRFRREISYDLAERARYRHDECRVLGIAQAAAAAVECIRTALAQPSSIMPFMEPFLPYYDSIRDEPVFVELLSDLDDAANNP